MHRPMGNRPVALSFLERSVIWVRTSWYWVRVDLGTRWHGYDLTWVRVGIGYEMTWVRVGKVRVDLGTT